MNLFKASFDLPWGAFTTILGASCAASHILPVESEAFSISLADGSTLTGEIDNTSGTSAKANILMVHGLGSSCHDPIAPGTYNILASTNNPNIKLHAFPVGGHIGFVRFHWLRLRMSFFIDECVLQACNRLLALG